MSVIIKDIEMPKACYDCRLYEADIYFCKAADREIEMDYAYADNGRCSFCPLVEVPAPEEFAREMRDCGNGTNNEAIHRFADDLMCDVLRELGYEEGVEAFKELPKWYS